MKTHTQGHWFPLEDRTMLRIATVHALTMEMAIGANTSSLTVVAKSFSTHHDLTSLSFICRARPVGEEDRFVGRNVSLLDPGVTAADLSSAGYLVHRQP